MNKKFEQFLIWYLPVLIVSRISKSLTIPYLTSIATGAGWSTGTYTSVMYLMVITASLEHIVAAIWIWKNGKKNQNRILWGAFALFAGLWGVLFFFAVSIYERISQEPSRPLKSNEQNF